MLLSFVDPYHYYITTSSVYRYVRALGAMYLRMTGSSVDCYKYLEPLFLDYRKIRVQQRDGSEFYKPFFLA